MTREDLNNLKFDVSAHKGLSEEEKQKVLESISNGKEYDFNTGYASIDRPWLKSYRKDADDYTTLFRFNDTVWNVTEELLKKYSDINFIEYFGRNISRETFANYVETWARTFRALGVQKN